MRLLTLVLAALLGGCAGDNRTTAVKIGEDDYLIPASHILSLAEEPNHFMRIKAPERRFELVYDGRTQGIEDALGWPVLFSLNDGGAPRIERHSSRDLKIVCRRAVSPRGGCGLRISIKGADWAVLFPSSHLQNANAIHEEALAALRAYAS